MTTIESFLPVTAEDLAAIGEDVWTAFLLEDPAIPGAAGTAPSGVVHASVGVHGGWTGQVALELSATAAAELARRMLGLDEVSAADVTDAVGELVNVVGGNVKSIVPVESSLGLPMVVEGTVARATAHDAVEVCSTSLDWAGHEVRVSVWAARQDG
jgi:chemotaxis protein CheX